MNAARCLAAALVVGCGTPRPSGALLAGDTVSIAIRSDVSQALVTRPVGSSDAQNATAKFTGACFRATGEMVIAEPEVILILMFAPAVLLACPLGGIMADTAVALANQRPASDDAVLSQEIARDVADRDFAVRFREALDAQLATHFHVVPERSAARAVIHVRLSAIEVAEYDDHDVALRLDGSTRVEQAGRHGSETWRRILVETPRRSHDEWTESHGELLIADIDAGLLELADAVALVVMKDPRAH